MKEVYVSKSPAKINLVLEIMGKRSDGYHEIRTIYQSINFFDTLTFENLKKDIEIYSNSSEISLDEKNLAFKGARILKEFAKVKKGIKITIKKKIPIMGGLGGGSSNGAVTIFALNKIWGLNLSHSTLLFLSSKLGSDAPFFLMGGTALGVGRGEEVYPLKDIPKRKLILFFPKDKVDTSIAYKKIDRVLTENKSSFKISEVAFKLEAGFLRSEDLFNRFEEVVFEDSEKIKTLRDKVKMISGKRVHLSGSGSTLFIFADKKYDELKIKNGFSDKSLWASTSTLRRKNYFKLITPTLKKENVG